MRYLHAAMVVALVGLLGVPAAMAVPPEDNKDEFRGLSLDGSFRGFSSDSGLIMKADPSVGYSFNRHVRTYVGLPVYFTRESSSSVATTAGSAGFRSGVGNAYVGLDVSAFGPVVDYSSTLELAAPTGDESRGFSTGLFSVDWSNTFSHSFASFMPFASAGLANTVSDTSFFVRPFSSHGLVGHFEVGSYWDITPRGSRPAISVGASGYAVRASGEQTIVSRIVARDQTAGTTGGTGTRVFQSQVEIVGLAELANDEGFSTWLTVTPKSKINFQLGYSRSARYDLDSVYAGVAFHLGK